MDVMALLKKLHNNISDDSAWNCMNEVYSRDRWSSFDKYRESAEYCEEALLSLGLSNVAAVPFPADGRTKFGDWIMPMSWDVREAKLEIIAPSNNSHNSTLAKWSDCPNSLIMWSAPTPPEGIAAELIILEEGTVAEVESLDIHGKIVFTPRHPTGIKAIVSQKQGAGIISDRLRTEDKSDAVQWINTWSDSPGGWAMHAHDSRLWGFSLSPTKGKFLRKLSLEGKIKLKATVSTRLYEGSLCYTTGIIKGTKYPDEEIILVAHINEQGANDNASGAATIIECAQAFQKLISSRELSHPKRTIRFLLMPESYGIMAYAARNIKKLQNALASINIDSGAGNYDSDNSKLTIYANPLCCRSFVDGVIVGIAQAFYKKHPDKWSLHKYTLAGDNFLCEPLIGVPNTWLEMGAGGNYWHSSEDTPDKVDPHSLRDLATITAGCAYTLASLDVRDLKQYANQATRTLPDEARQILQMSMPEMHYDAGKQPKRKFIGPLTLDDISPEKWKVVRSSPRWWSPYLAAWWWANGNYTISQISQFVDMEFRKTPTELEEFFEFLSELDYMA